MQGGPFEVKVCIIGDTDVGKTSLSMRYCHGEMPENATPTIGASFLQKRLNLDGTELSLQIWDTAGQERFRSMAPMYYRGAKAAILVFDLTNEDTFHRVVSWLKDLKAHADPDIIICLAGNKCDLEATFDTTMCDEYVKNIGGKFVKTSALTGSGVDVIFNELAKGILQTYLSKMQVNDKGTKDVLKLGDSRRTVKQSKNGCC